MPRILLSLFLGILLIGCKNVVTEEDLTLLNGYWEIEKVTFPNGEAKDYNVNTTIDFIEIEALKGYRKKLHPKFDGTYDATDDAVLFSVRETDGLYSIYYSSALEEWKEDLIALQEHNFTIMTPEGVLYTYRRYQSININP